MPIPFHSATDYLWQFQRLLPRGRVWHRGWGTIEDAHLLTLMPTWAALDARAGDLVGDAFPCTTVELLPEWEATLGLPDPCVQPPLSTLQQRQAAVCAKFVARGGSSRDYFIQIAASMGYEITIATFRPFQASHNAAGQPLYGPEWAFTWHITVTATTAAITWFSASVSRANEPLASFSDQTMLCLFEALKPAHTTIIWNLEGA
jgi:uncharacterized protein YmfQ (DUF2313 family)